MILQKKIKVAKEESLKKSFLQMKIRHDEFFFVIFNSESSLDLFMSNKNVGLNENTSLPDSNKF